jgi:hypothetical protein
LCADAGSQQENLEMTDQIIEVEAEEVKLGSLSVSGPEEVLEQASRIATALAKVINDRKLYTNIQGKKYVRVEGWNTLGALLGVLPREVSARAGEDGSYEAVVELIRASDGMVIGRGSAVCSIDETNWKNRDAYARRSMAITRATGKAFRLGFSWIMTLAGYEPTPWEEMPPDPPRIRESASPHDPASQPQKSQTRPSAAGEKKNGSGASSPNKGGQGQNVPEALISSGLAVDLSDAAALLNRMPANLRGDPDLAIRWAGENLLLPELGRSEPVRHEAEYTELEEAQPGGAPEQGRNETRAPKEIAPAAFWKAVDEYAGKQGIRAEDLRKRANQILAENGGNRAGALESIQRKAGKEGK